MKLNEFLDDLMATHADIIESSTVIRGTRALLEVHRDALVRVAEVLYTQKHCRFIIASGLDSKEGLEILYHFSYDPAGFIINLRVLLPHDKPEVESLTVLFEAADWIECEMHEILGIHFLHHKNLKPLVSEGNWKAGEYPYRRKQHEPEKIKP